MIDERFLILAWEQQKYIRRGLDQLELTSCIKFVEWTGEQDYIEVIVSFLPRTSL